MKWYGWLMAVIAKAWELVAWMLCVFFGFCLSQPKSTSLYRRNKDETSRMYGCRFVRRSASLASKLTRQDCKRIQDCNRVPGYCWSVSLNQTKIVQVLKDHTLSPYRLDLFDLPSWIPVKVWPSSHVSDRLVERQTTYVIRILFVSSFVSSSHEKLWG